MSSACHPETDGQTEVLNRCLETYLRCFALEPRGWAEWIPWAEYWYNTTYHSSAGMTPFEAVYGRAPPSITTFSWKESSVAALAQDLQDRDETIRQLKYNLQRAQQVMIKYANRHRKEVSFQIEMVYLKLRPHKQQSICKRIYQKLPTRYYGPFKVIDKIGEVAYKLQQPAESRVHHVFHVSCLKKAIGNGQNLTGTLHEELGKDLTVTYQPEEVLARRSKTRGRKQVKQLLVR